MERLEERIKLAKRALTAFGEVLEISKPSNVERDAAIQRFEFTFEACWKAGKQFLFDIEGLDAGSPKGVIRYSREIGMFTEEETILGLKMVNDRNLTVHTYNEELAVEIFKQLPEYYELLRKWLSHIIEKFDRMK